MKVECDDCTDADLTPDRVLEFRHTLASCGLFDDAALTDLLDGYPASDLNVSVTDYHTSADGRTIGVWRHGTVEGLTPEQILRAARHGRIWLNIKRLGDNKPAYNALVQHLYGGIAKLLNCAIPVWQRTTLLVSSPRAVVYYHADAIANFLWHVRGHKKVIVPALA